MAETRAARASVRAAFDRAAPAYDGAATVQREAGDLLAAFGAAQLAARARTQPARGIIVDAGCGTGHGLAHLAALCPHQLRVAVDLAPAMLRETRRRAAAHSLPLCADLEQLPLASGSAALLWSSLAVQWCDPQAVMAEFARVLAVDGLALIATLGPRTLHELDAAFATVDDARHRNHFHRLSDWAAHARAHGLQLEGCAQHVLHARAADLGELLQAIKAIGAATVVTGRRRRPLGPQAWRQVQAAYEIHRGADGLLAATYDVLLLALHKPR